jgi:DNA-binding transcriptional ArsR family regulator
VGSSRQAISQHLAVLEEAGLVHTTWQGRRKHHFVDTRPLRVISTRWRVGD